MFAVVAASLLAMRQGTRLRREQARLVARAHEEERAWVASELHDDVLQRVALVRAEVEQVTVRLGTGAVAVPVDTHLRGINAELVDLAVTVRRIAARLHPTVVDQVGLVPALESLVQEFDRAGEVEVSLDASRAPSGLPHETARAAYRIAQEALRNVARHAQARTAFVSLEAAPGALILRIRDDGRGFDAAEQSRHGIGLASMRERALIAGGEVKVTALPGQGTTITAHLPA